MKLVDLDPSWITKGGRVIGVRFICPNNDGPGPHPEGHSVCVLFANPPDGGHAHPDDPSCPGNNGGNRWMRTGIDFEDMTLAPSVDCTRGENCPRYDHTNCGHTACWHGNVNNGELSNVRR